MQRMLIKRNWNKEQNVVVQLAKIRTYIKSLFKSVMCVCIMYCTALCEVSVFPNSAKDSP